jgi:hypothetical protein
MEGAEYRRRFWGGLGQSSTSFGVEAKIFPAPILRACDRDASEPHGKKATLLHNVRQ